MKKSTSKIATLPYAVRLQVNARLRDNKKLVDVAEFLFSLPDESGLPYSGRWLAENGDRDKALHACEVALSAYWKSPEYRGWLVDDIRNNAVGNFVTNMGALTDASKGGDALDEAAAFNQLMLSVAGENLLKFMRGEAKAEDVAVFFKAGGKLVMNATKIEGTKLDRDKFEFDAAKAALKFATELKRIASDKSLTEGDRLTTVRQMLFGQLPQEATA